MDYEVELHVPVTEGIFLPFLGEADIGQDSSADGAHVLDNGSVAIYRQAPWSQSDTLELVRESALFPGDFVEFHDRAGCPTPSAGFARVIVEDGTTKLQLVASTQEDGASIIIRRSSPGLDETRIDSKITFKMTLFEALFNHPLALGFGIVITLFVVIKEITEFVHHRDKELELDPHQLARKMAFRFNHLKKQKPRRKRR